MTVVARAATYDTPNQTVLWKDNGPGNWSFVRTATGIVTVTFPETFLSAPAVLLSSNAVGLTPPYVANYIYTSAISATGCTVQCGNYINSGAFNGPFTIEVVGDIPEYDGSLLTAGLANQLVVPASGNTVADTVDGLTWDVYGTKVAGPGTPWAAYAEQLAANAFSGHRPKANMATSGIEAHSYCWWMKSASPGAQMVMAPGGMVSPAVGYSGIDFNMNGTGHGLTLGAGGTAENAGQRISLTGPAGSGPLATDGNWHHIAFVATEVNTVGTSYTLYIDGSPYGNYTYTSGTAVSVGFNSSSQCYLNRSWSSSTTYVAWGAIADFRIYSRALSDRDVSAIYSGLG